MLIAPLVIGLPSLLAAQSPLPLTYAPKATTAAITAADLMSRLYIFADDSMMGRETGTRGHIISTEYIARELRRLGLQPAGDNGTFFQDVPLVNRPFDPSRSTLAVNGITLVPGEDYVPQQFRGLPRAFDGAPAIYGGTFGDTAGLPSAELFRGKVVVFAGGRAGLATPAFNAAVSSAAALVRASGVRLPAAQVRAASWPTANMLMRGASQTDAPLTILATDRAAEVLLGVPLERAIRGAMGNTVRGSMAFGETPAPARNVVAILRGSDAELRNTYVAIGAHSDHIGILPGDAQNHDSLHTYNQARFAIVGMVPRGVQPSPAQRARVDSIHIDVDSLHRVHPMRRDSVRNGADDDGSGSVTLLEIAEALANRKTRPKRSILFVWHTGEEKGLLGSRWYSEHSTVPRDSIVAQLNMDMVGRGEARDLPVGAPNYLALVGSRRLSSQLGDAVEDVNRREPQPFAFDYSFDAPGHPENIYCRSDHFHYARWGIPVVFFTTGLHGDYHQVTDEPQYISYDHMARVGQLVHDVAVRVANMTQRPVVDGVRLDPTGACRQ
jgi:Peptidase family M28